MYRFSHGSFLRNVTRSSSCTAARPSLVRRLVARGPPPRRRAAAAAEKRSAARPRQHAWLSCRGGTGWGGEACQLARAVRPEAVFPVAPLLVIQPGPPARVTADPNPKPPRSLPY